MAVTATRKRDVFFVTSVHFNLVKRTFYVDFRNVLTLRKIVNKFLDTWYRVVLNNCMFVQFPIIMHLSVCGVKALVVFFFTRNVGALYADFESLIMHC